MDLDLDEYRYRDAITFLEWLSDEADLPAAMQQVLQRAAEKLRAREYQAAHDLCWQAINQVSPNSLSDLSHGSAGLCRVHLGAVFYAVGDGFLDEAAEAFSEASKHLRGHGRAQAVAEFALGATYACKGEKTQVYQHITPEVITRLKWYPAAKDVDEKWAEIRGRLGPNNFAPPHVPSPHDNNDAPEPLPPDPVLTGQPPPDIPSETEIPPRQRALIVAALATVVVGCGILALILSGSIISLLAYLVVLPSVTLLITSRLKCKVEQDQALIIETGGAPKVRWGPRTYYRWPTNEHFRALVSLSPLQYTSPPQSIKLRPDKSVTIRLLVYYRVNAAGGNELNVVESVYRTQLAGRKPESQQGSQRSPKMLAPHDLQRIWERRLLQDIIAALNQVLPGVTYEQLAGRPIDARSEIIKRLHASLLQRANEWGMTVQEVGIADVSENKP